MLSPCFYQHTTDGTLTVFHTQILVHYSIRMRYCLRRGERFGCCVMVISQKPLLTSLAVELSGLDK